MKKVMAVFLIILVFLVTINVFTVDIFAESSNLLSVKSYTSGFETTNKLEESTNSELVEIKSKTKNEIKEYEDLYGSKTYGYTAYILNKVRIFSIPLCFLGIAIGSIYKYTLGIRKLDVSDKGFALIITFVTLLVICQLLPLIFTIVVQGWRG